MNRHVRLLTAMILAVFCATTIGESNKNIVSINSNIAAIDDSIRRNEYPFLHIEQHSESEGSPPATTMYYRGQLLVAVVVSVGHETCTKEFRYYYHSNGNIKKYMEIIKDRPDNPQKKARIYAEDGTIIWENTDEEALKPAELKKLFTTIQNARMKFIGY